MTYKLFFSRLWLSLIPRICIQLILQIYNPTFFNQFLTVSWNFGVSRSLCYKFSLSFSLWFPFSDTVDTNVILSFLAFNGVTKIEWYLCRLVSLPNGKHPMLSYKYSFRVYSRVISRSPLLRQILEYSATWCDLLIETRIMKRDRMGQGC